MLTLGQHYLAPSISSTRESDQHSSSASRRFGSGGRCGLGRTGQGKGALGLRRGQGWLLPSHPDLPPEPGDLMQASFILHHSNTGTEPRSPSAVSCSLPGREQTHLLRKPLSVSQWARIQLSLFWHHWSHGLPSSSYYHVHCTRQQFFVVARIP